MTFEEALKWASSQLSHREGGRDARRLLSHLELRPGFELDAEALEELKSMVSARSGGQPIAQIVGYRDFWKYRFKVTPNVLDPRPETEHLLETAIEICKPTRLADLGTGSGCIAISLAIEWPGADVIATDASSKALEVAVMNATALEATNIEFRLGEWCTPLDGSFDLIVSNPPYISAQEWKNLELDVLSHEPMIALTPGGDGLSAYRDILQGAHGLIVPEGFLIFEHGAEQAEAIKSIAFESGFQRVRLVQDLSGKDRISAFQRL